jgi:hypothetical protein
MAYWRLLTMSSARHQTALSPLSYGLPKLHSTPRTYRWGILSACYLVVDDWGHVGIYQMKLGLRNTCENILKMSDENMEGDAACIRVIYVDCISRQTAWKVYL